jgi:tRNA (guanine37-N1)-methyltransferase
MAEPATTFEVFTLFPEAVRAFARAGLLGRAVQRGVVAVETTDFRDFTTDRHRTVDDTPFGGGPGMVIKPEPVVAALEHVAALRGAMHRVLLTPSAPRFDQRAAERLATLPRIALLCGRYEGIDDRVREHFVDECFSLGDFVLGGGEVAALAIIEAVSRLRDGVVGNRESVEGDSFASSTDGMLLEFPQYTRPADFRGHRVPDVLQGGDHQAIAQWRRRASLARTWALRPDLRPPQRWPALAIHAVVAGAPDARGTARARGSHRARRRPRARGRLVARDRGACAGGVVRERGGAAASAPIPRGIAVGGRRERERIRFGRRNDRRRDRGGGRECRGAARHARRRLRRRTAIGRGRPPTTPRAVGEPADARGPGRHLRAAGARSRPRTQPPS